MLPLQLTIEGLYSYQTRQTIDFSELTSAGLFGIFGAVGSGKSSILEAIGFALYGETERMNSKDGRAYNMMNLRSNRSYIEFDFKNHEERIFRAVREFKRNSKRFDDVKISNATFYEKKDGQWIPLDHTNASEILGLSYANFKRTIIIPQGQFKEFLELGATDRTRMMKEIFGLHKYDLQDKASSKLAETKYQMAELEGKLGNYGSISEELVNENKENLEVAKKETADAKVKHQSLETTFQRIKKDKEDFDQLKSKEAELAAKESERQETEKLESQLEIFERTERSFKTLLTDRNRINSEMENTVKVYNTTKTEFDLISEKLNHIKQNLLSIESDYLDLEKSKQKASDLLNVSKILDFENQKKLITERIIKGETTIADSKKAEQETNQLIQSQLSAIAESKSKKTDTKVLMEVEVWFSTKAHLQKLMKQNQDLLHSKNEEINKQQELLDDFPADWQEKYATLTASLLAQKQKLMLEKSHLEVSKKLSEFAQAIEEGQACPLCGSTSHPKILASKDLSQTEKLLEEQIINADKETEKINKNSQQIEKILELLGFLRSQKKEIEKQYSELETQFLQHQEQFVWSHQFDSENESDFRVHKKEVLALEKDIEKLENSLAENQKKLEQQKKETSRFEDAILDFRNKIISLETSIFDTKNSLTTLVFEDFENEDPSEVKQQSETLSQQNLSIEQQHQQWQKDLLETVPKVASLEALKQQTSNQLEELKIKTKDIDKAITSEIEKSSFCQIEEVEAILKQDLDTLSLRKTIQDFKLQFNTLKEIINSLKISLSKSNFDETIFEQKQTEFLESKDHISEKEKKLAVLETQLSELQKNFETKKILLADYNKLSERKTNLDMLFNLFRGGKFVEYVSAIYLKQLCDHANSRFHRMTRNQLSLQVNDKNEFEVIDYLNEGRTRSVKTLSGGQSFQVSLSLALALAESVQTQVKSDKNFFFIDEGFGTQDPESVNLVFETLSNLQKENRIVGIISHVDELKERIPISLNIIKDQETGSSIEMIAN